MAPGEVAVPFYNITDDWYVACRSSEVARIPIQVTILGIPIVIFRASGGGVGALSDRCPHRNVPLSAGKVRGETLECEYHGWRFRADGSCVFSAGISDDAIPRACHAEAFPVREQQGYIWVYPSRENEPDKEPFWFPLLDDRSYTTERAELEVETSLHQSAENALDVPHTAYLHGGLFRRSGDVPGELEVQVRTCPGGIEAEYIGEERPKGLAAALLAPGGGEVKHSDRFLLPSITQVDYRVGEKTHLLVTVAMTPVGPLKTRFHAVVSFRLGVSGWIVRPFLRPLFMRIFRQDADVLRRQSENILRFGGERFASTDADILGREIQRILKARSLGEKPPEKTVPIRSVRLLV